MKVRKKVTIVECPVCYDQLVHVRLNTGHEFIKCKSNCDPISINLRIAAKYKLPKPKKLKEVAFGQFFLDVISHARSIGKQISNEDKEQERVIWQRMRLLKSAQGSGIR